MVAQIITTPPFPIAMITYVKGSEVRAGDHRTIQSDVTRHRRRTWPAEYEPPKLIEHGMTPVKTLFSVMSKTIQTKRVHAPVQFHARLEQGGEPQRPQHRNQRRRRLFPLQCSHFDSSYHGDASWEGIEDMDTCGGFVLRKACGCRVCNGSVTPIFARRDTWSFFRL